MCFFSVSWFNGSAHHPNLTTVGLTNRTNSSENPPKCRWERLVQSFLLTRSLFFVTRATLSVDNQHASIKRASEVRWEGTMFTLFLLSDRCVCVCVFCSLFSSSANNLNGIICSKIDMLWLMPKYEAMTSLENNIKYTGRWCIFDRITFCSGIIRAFGALATLCSFATQRCASRSACLPSSPLAPSVSVSRAALLHSLQLEQLEENPPGRLRLAIQRRTKTRAIHLHFDLSTVERFGWSQDHVSFNVIY